MGEPPESIYETMRSRAKQKHVPQLKRKEQKWNFIQIYNVVLVQLMQRIRFDARTCVSIPLISVERASSGCQPICQCLDSTHTHSHAHTDCFGHCSLASLTSLHSSYMTCDNNNKPANKQISISRMESGAIVGTNFIPAKCAGFPRLVNETHSEHEHK